MNADPRTTAAFTGHRTYDGAAAASLAAAVERAYARGYRTFLSGMAVGFDLAAAEAVLAFRAEHPGVRHVAVIPFRGQEERFSAEDRGRFQAVEAASDEVVILSETFHRGCYAVGTSTPRPHCRSGPPIPSSSDIRSSLPIRKTGASCDAPVRCRIPSGNYFQLRILWKSYSSGLATYFLAAS